MDERAVGRECASRCRHGADKMLQRRDPIPTAPLFFDNEFVAAHFEHDNF